MAKKGEKVDLQHFGNPFAAFRQPLVGAWVDFSGQKLDLPS